MNEQTVSQNATWIMVWEYHVRESHRQEFERIYGPNGDWAKLFGRATGYLGTRLLHDTEDHARYVTFDCWQSESAFQKFREQHAADYAALDQRCELLTESEKLIGAITSPR